MLAGRGGRDSEEGERRQTIHPLKYSSFNLPLFFLLANYFFYLTLFNSLTKVFVFYISVFRVLKDTILFNFLFVAFNKLGEVVPYL